MEGGPTSPEQKPRVKLSKSWVWLLPILAMAIIAGAVRWGQFGQIQELQKEVAAQKNVAETAQKEVANLKVDIANLKADPSAPIAKDSDLILAATDAYVRAPIATAHQKFNYTIKENTGEFAKVTVGVAEGAGYEVTVKKVGASWTVLFAGQDLPPKEVGEKYGLPKGYYHE